MSNIRRDQERIFSNFEEKEEQSEKQIIRNYQGKLIDLKGILGEFFEQYEDNGILTYEEMAIYGRLEKMQEDMRGLTVSLYSENTREISSMLKTTYTDSFKGMQEIANHAWGNQSLIGIMRDEEITRAITNDISGLKWIERMDLHREQTISRIQATLVRGLHDGETYAQMANRLNEVIGKDVPNAIGIVRTESYRVFSQAKKDRLDRVEGIDKIKEWGTAGDEVVRNNHKPMNGVRVPYNQDFVLPNGNTGFAPHMIGDPADDINCRCFWTVDIADESFSIADFYEDDTKDIDVWDNNIDEILIEMRSEASKVRENNIRLYYEHQLNQRDAYQVDRNLKTPLQYNPNTGIISINPDHADFGMYDIKQSLSHEIGHKISHEVLDSFAATEYLSTVQSVAEQVMNNKQRYTSLLEDKEVFNNMAISDTLSALSMGDIKGSYGHSQPYWERDGTVEAEIFANIFSAVATNDQVALNFLESEFKTLFEVFKKLF